MEELKGISHRTVKEPGAAEADFALTYRHPGPLYVPKGGFVDWPDKQLKLPSWLSEKDIHYYAEKFDKTGFTGGLNYDRAFDLNWELTAPWTGTQVKVPVKFIVGDLDLTYNTTGTKEYIDSCRFKKDVPFLEEVVVMEGVGHFISVESDEITAYFYE